MALIEIRGLSKAFGSVKSVDGFDRDIEPGEFITPLGPSGSGKNPLAICNFQNLFRTNQAPIIDVVAAALVVISIIPI
jgi:ABC-type multidrug transport system ATPase subunit